MQLLFFHRYTCYLYVHFNQEMLLFPLYTFLLRHPILNDKNINVYLCLIIAMKYQFRIFIAHVILSHHFTIYHVVQYLATKLT